MDLLLFALLVGGRLSLLGGVRGEGIGGDVGGKKEEGELGSNGYK